MRMPVRIAVACVATTISMAAVAPVALASEAPASAGQVATLHEPNLREALDALLNSEDPEVRAFMANFSEEELAQFRAAANAEGQPRPGAHALKAPNWKSIASALKKIGGFTKAVAGKYDDFKKWVDGRPWYVKYAIKLASPGLSLYDIWWHFHH